MYSTCFFSYESKRVGRLGVLRRLYCKFFKKHFCLSIGLGRLADLIDDGRWVFNLIPSRVDGISSNTENPAVDKREVFESESRRSCVSKN